MSKLIELLALAAIGTVLVGLLGYEAGNFFLLIAVLGKLIKAEPPTAPRETGTSGQE